MAEENKTIDEKSLSEPFKELSQLPTKKEEISDANKAEAEKLFANIVESVKQGHTVTIAEYNLLSNMYKLYDFNVFLYKLDDEKKLATVQELKTVAGRKVISNFARPIKATSLQDRKKEIKKRIAALNDAMKGMDGYFTDDQVKQLQDAVTGFSTVKGKKRDAKTGEEKEVTYNIDVQSLFVAFKPAKGKQISPAFTALYNQAYPDVQPNPADVFANRLEDVNEEIVIQAADEQTQEDVVPQPEEQQDESQPQPDAQQDEQQLQPDAQQDEQPQPEVQLDEQQPQPEVQEPTSLTEEEVNKYMDEIRNSENLDSWLKEYPTPNGRTFDAAMDIGVEDENGNLVEEFSALNTAIALGSTVNILKAYDHYKNDPERLDQLDEVAKVWLETAGNVPGADNFEETPDKALGILALADKIKEKSPDTYNVVTNSLASSLKAYDNEYFGTKSDEELQQNFDEVKSALKNLPANEVDALMEGYTFTDDKGKPLSDKDIQKQKALIVEMAQLMVAEKLVQIGNPGNDHLMEMMKETIQTGILNKPLEDEVKAAAELMTQTKLEQRDKFFNELKQGFDQNKPEIIDPLVLNLAKKELNTPDNPTEEQKQALEAKQKEIKEKLEQHDPDLTQKATNFLKGAADQKYPVRTEAENITLLCAGNEQALQEVAELLTYKSMGLEYGTNITDNVQKADFLVRVNKEKAKLSEAVKSQTTFSKKELAGQHAAAMVHAQTFEKRAGQHFGKNKLFTTTNSWLVNLDKKLTKAFGKPYTQTKQALKAVTQIGFGIAKTQVIMGALSAVNPALAAGYMGYLAYKSVKSSYKQLKDPEKTMGEKIAIVAGTTITTGLTAMGISGAAGHLGATIMAQPLLRSSIVAAAQTLPNGVKGWMLSRKCKKLDEQISEEKDPAKLKELMEQRTALRLQQRANNKDAIVKAGVTLGVGAVMSTSPAKAATAELHGLFQHSDAQPDVHGVASEEHTAADSKVEAQTVDSKVEAQTVDSKVETQAAAEAESGKPDDAHGAKAPEGLTDEQKTQNATEAAEKGSGHVGKSDMESMQKDLDSKDGAKLGYTPEEKAAMMKSLAEGFGKESYEAMHAAMAEPRILAEQMGITADVEASAQAAGINPETDYSKAVLNHLATHPELADNDGFKAYVAEHFDAQDRFHSSNYTVRVETHTSTERPVLHTAQAPEAPRETKVTYTPVDHLPGERPAHQETIHVQPEQTHHVYNEPVIPPHGIAVNGAMAYVDGKEYHQSMEFSNKLGYTLNDRAILGVYQNNQNPNDFVMITAPLDAYGNPIPDGRLTADHRSYEYLRDAQKFSHTGYERQTYKMQYGGTYGGHGARVCYGTGVIGNTTVSTQDIAGASKQQGLSFDEKIYRTHATMDAIDHGMSTAEHVGHGVAGIIDHFKHINKGRS